MSAAHVKVVFELTMEIGGPNPADRGWVRGDAIVQDLLEARPWLVKGRVLSAGLDDAEEVTR